MHFAQIMPLVATYHIFTFSWNKFYTNEAIRGNLSCIPLSCITSSPYLAHISHSFLILKLIWNIVFNAGFWASFMHFTRRMPSNSDTSFTISKSRCTTSNGTTSQKIQKSGELFFSHLFVGTYAKMIYF